MALLIALTITIRQPSKRLGAVDEDIVLGITSDACSSPRRQDVPALYLTRTLECVQPTIAPIHQILGCCVLHVIVPYTAPYQSVNRR